MRKADNLTTILCAVVMKSGNLNFLETSGPPQICNGTDLHSTANSVYNIRGVIFTFDQIVALVTE
jgi:hypothetical protein